MKGVRIDDASVEDHSVSLGFFGRFQGFGVGVPFDLVGIVYGDDSGFVEGYSDFVDVTLAAPRLKTLKTLVFHRSSILQIFCNPL